MESTFTSHDQAERLRDLFVGEWSGRAVFRRGSEERALCFHRGMIVFGSVGGGGDAIGARLVEQGAISAGALDEAKRSAEESQDPRQIYAALVHRDLVTKDTLQSAVREATIGIVRELFAWERGEVRLEAGNEDPGVLDADVRATLELILGGVAVMSGFDRVLVAMTGLDHRLRPKRRSPIPLERLALSPTEGFVLSRVDGNSSARDLFAMLPPDEEEPAARFLFGLLVLGVLEYDPPIGGGSFRVGDLLRDHADRQAVETVQEKLVRRVYEQVRHQNAYELLSVAPGASATAIERAYEAMKEPLGKDRLLPEVRERFRNEIALIESRLIEAYLTLTQPETHRPQVVTTKEPDIEVDDLLVRVEMDKAKSKLAQEQASKVADAYYSKARRAMRDGDFHNAVQYGKLAISYNQTDARYYSMLADCLARNPDARWQRLAEDNYTRATQLDPWNAEYWMGLGRFYKKRGLFIRARKQFEEALKLVPQSDEVVRELDSLV